MEILIPTGSICHPHSFAFRYGVVYVDADNLGNGTYKRYKKKSFKFYKDFIEKEKNGVKS